MSVEMDLLAAYVSARAAKDDAARAKAVAEENLKSAEDALAEYMSDREIEATATYPGLGRVALIPPDVAFPSYDKEKEGEVFAFIRARGDEDIIKESVRHSSLKSFIKRILGEDNAVPEFFTYYLKPGLRWYKDKG
jgi:hypothetical protein